MPNMPKFSISVTSKGITFYKKIKSFFGKEKLQEVSEKEVFAPLSISGRLFPDIDNLTLDDILWMKQKFNLQNHLSDFNCKVKFDIEKFEDSLVEENKKYFGNVKFDGTIKKEDNSPICSFTINTQVINSDYRPTKEYYEALFASTYSGTYSSLENIDNIYDSIEKTYEIKHRWVCEECNKEFHNRLEFLSHLIETKHYDSIFEEYIHDKDVVFVKNSRNLDEKK